MNTKKRRKSVSLHVQLIVVMLLLCIVPSIAVSVHLIEGYFRGNRNERVKQVQEMCTDMVNRIQNTGYLTDSTQNDLSSAMDMAAQIFEGRLLVVNSELQVVKDTYGRDGGKILISEEVVVSIKGDAPSYLYEYADSMEVISQIKDSSGENVIGCVIFSFSDQSYVEGHEEMVRNIVFLDAVLIVVACCLILFLSAKMIFPLKKLSFTMSRLREGYLEENVSVTGNREVEEIVDSINVMLEDMRNTDKRRQEFVSNVSHELKTPLTSMKILAESLVDQQNVPEELYQEFLGDINNEIDRETKIITDLLNLVRLDRKEGEMHIAQVSINELLEIVMRRLRPIAKKQNVEMIFESFRPVLAEVDEVKMSLVFTNLIENAIKYNKDGGRVKVSLNADHRYFYVRVEDTGEGIPDDAKKYIFDRFYRVDKARSRETGGTGLGLAITKSAVVMHRGNIKVSGKEGEGAVFVVRIPLTFVPEYSEP